MGKASSPAYTDEIGQMCSRHIPELPDLLLFSSGITTAENMVGRQYSLCDFPSFSPNADLMVSAFAFAVPQNLMLTNHHKFLPGSQLPSV